MIKRFKIPKRVSFRTRLFLVMIGMLFIAGLLILGTTFIQYESQRENYHLGRLERKEFQIQTHIDYLAEKYNLMNKPLESWEEFSSDFEKINKIHNVQYSLFKLEGNPLFIYHSPLEIIANNYKLSKPLLDKINQSQDGSYIEHYKSDIDKFHASYKILKDRFNKPYAILFFPYFEDVSFSENELNTFIENLYQIYILLLAGVIFIAYFLSKFVTRSLETIRVRMGQMGLEKKNEKINGKTPSVLISSSLINPPANIAPPANASQSPEFSGKGKTVCLLKTIHKPPKAKSKVITLSMPGLFFKNKISKIVVQIGVI